MRMNFLSKMTASVSFIAAESLPGRLRLDLMSSLASVHSEVGLQRPPHSFVEPGQSFISQKHSFLGAF